jgi:hypothetical protein|tara:strand:+ start:63 stop:761 length:699 start_codon:yes stop_codon:yes gene_type:complete
MVNIDTVYQRVLAFANKEQRGYVTPQEFNLFANQAQMEILNQYFYDVNQFGVRGGNDTEYSDMLSVLQEKLSELEVRTIGQPVVSGVYDHRTIDDLYKLGTITTAGDTGVEIEQVNNNEWYHMRSAPLTRPTLTRPVFVNRIDGLNIYPSTIDKIDISYTKSPNTPSWAYFVVNEKALYNVNDSVNFELHSSEETELIYKILKFAGVAMKRDDIMRAAQNMEASQVQQEKQK